jgi:EAL domain-containing protein (putative c-di-GMP-specific phosphodiesterase class I)
VFARVCEDAVRWPGLQVGVNVSPAQLRRPEFVDMVRRTLERTGCDPRNIAIEITEGLLMDCSSGQTAHLNELRKMGISLWLDDFGAGHSGLSYLREFEIDVIKIDKSFVQDMRSSHTNRVFVSTIAQMGHGLDQLVVAEGVETAEDLVLVRAAGCSHVQGYHFAKPMKADEVAGYIQTRIKIAAA